MKTPTISRRVTLSRGGLTQTLPGAESVSTEPTDKCNVVKICMFCLGIGIILAESMLLSIGTYYKKEYPNYPHLVYFVLPAYAMPNLLFLLIMIEYGSKLSFRIRIIGAFIIQSVILSLIPKKGELLDAKYMIICYALIGMNTAIVNCSILGFMNLLDSSYQQITLSGQAFAGIIASILRIITRYIYPSSIEGIEDSTRIFFYVGALYCILSAFIFINVTCNQYIQYKKNIFAMSIAAYFRSIKQEIEDRETTNTSLMNDETSISMSQSRTKCINTRSKTKKQSGITPRADPLELRESTSLFDDEFNPANPYKNSKTSSYQKMSDSTTKINSTINTHDTNTNDTGTTETEGYDNNNNDILQYKHVKYQKIQKHKNKKHLSLTHLAALQNQKEAALSLLGNNGERIYVTDAMLDLIYDRKKRNKRGNKEKQRKRNDSKLTNSNNNINTASVTLPSTNVSTKYVKIGLFKMVNRLYPKIQHFCHVLFLLNMLTWSVFPGLISGKIQSEFSYVSENHWMSILLATEFFVFNFIGRLILSSPKFCNYILCCCCKYDRESYKGYIIVSCSQWMLCCRRRNFIINAMNLLLFTMIRIIIIYPIFILVYIGFFKNFNLNWISHILMAITGLTHGYIYCVAFIAAPQFVARHHREAAVSILRFSHFCGVLVGSCVALLVSFVVN